MYCSVVTVQKFLLAVGFDRFSGKTYVLDSFFFDENIINLCIHLQSYTVQYHTSNGLQPCNSNNPHKNNKHCYELTSYLFLRTCITLWSVLLQVKCVGSLSSLSDFTLVFLIVVPLLIHLVLAVFPM